MNADLLKSHIKYATERNILAFDCNAGHGQLTKKLLSLMIVLAKRNDYGNIVDFYVPAMCESDVILWNRTFWKRPNIGRYAGINLHYTDALDEYGYLLEYFQKELGGNLQSNDLKLVLGITDENKCLIGSC